MTSSFMVTLPGQTRTSRSTRRGLRAAVHAATHPPSDSPDRWARSRAEHIKQCLEVVGIGVDRVRLVGPVAVAVADEVKGDDPEVPGECGDVAQECLEVASGSVHEHQGRTFAGLEHPRAHAARHDVAQREGRGGELWPDASPCCPHHPVVQRTARGPLVGQLAERAAEVQQGPPVTPRRLDDAAEEDPVVARVMARVALTAQSGDRSLKRGTPSGPSRTSMPAKRSASRVANRSATAPMSFRRTFTPNPLDRPKRLVRPPARTHAEQHQGRLQRHRRERCRCEACPLAGFGAGGDDGDAGREP